MLTTNVPEKWYYPTSPAFQGAEGLSFLLQLCLFFFKLLKMNSFFLAI